MGNPVVLYNSRRETATKQNKNKHQKRWCSSVGRAADL